MSYPPHIHLPQIFLQIFLLLVTTILKYSLHVFLHLFAYPFHTNPTLLSHSSHYNPSFFSQASQTQCTLTLLIHKLILFAHSPCIPHCRHWKTFNLHDPTFCDSPCTLARHSLHSIPSPRVNPNPCPLSAHTTPNSWYTQHTLILHSLHTHSHLFAYPFHPSHAHLPLPHPLHTHCTLFSHQSYILTNHCPYLVSKTSWILLESSHTHNSSNTHLALFTHSFAHHVPLHIFFTLILCFESPSKEFPGSPVVRSQCFHCWGHGFDP